MNTISQRRKLSRLGSALAATVFAIVRGPSVAGANPLPIYAGPTFSPSAGGYLAEDLGTGLYPSIHVNDAGTAVATGSRYSSTGSWQGHRALRWSASSAVVELGGGPTSLRAERINAAGTTVGSAVAPNELHPYGAIQYRPTRWAASGTAATILEHPYVHAHVYSYANTFLYDINDAGTAVGTVWKVSRDKGGPPMPPVDEGTRAGRWDGSGTTLTELGFLGTREDGFTYAFAYAINSAGVTVGQSQKYLPDGTFLGSVAVRWDASSIAATELGRLGAATPTGYSASKAIAINSAGTVLGTAVVYDDAGNYLRYVAVRWDASGTPTELDSLPGDTYTVVVESPAALNDAGTAVGWAPKISHDAPHPTVIGTRALRWDGSGTAVTELGHLGTHPVGTTYSEAAAVNAAGTAVGFADTYSATGTFLGERAVYWGDDAVAVNLNTLIDPASGWVLNRAFEISNTGWIVGIGSFDPDGPGGQAAYPRHFLMQVPATVLEPGTLALLGVALPALLRRRRA